MRTFHGHPINRKLQLSGILKKQAANHRFAACFISVAERVGQLIECNPFKYGLIDLESGQGHFYGIGGCLRYGVVEHADEGCFFDLNRSAGPAENGAEVFK